jgi:hypothetical protein
MPTTIKVLLWIIRAAGVVQIVLGILFWTGHAYTYVPVHIVVGSLLVIALWAMAVLALVAGARRGLAVFELMWALALAVFGIQQATILVGSLHWIVRVVHLLMAISAMELGDMLAKAIRATRSDGTRPSDAERVAPPVRQAS